MLKNSPLMIANVVVDVYHSEGCTLFIYPWGALNHGPLALLSYHIKFQLSYKTYKDICLVFTNLQNCIATYLKAVLY